MLRVAQPRHREPLLHFESFITPAFWIGLSQIVVIDILLGGDNAVVIALASRKLPRAERRQAIVYGTAGAVLLRVVLVVFALRLLELPLLRVAGALMLLWIGARLMQPEHDDAAPVRAQDRLWAAIRTVILADLVMSLDNVIAIAGAAQRAGGDRAVVLVVFGLLLSVPLIVWGSGLVVVLMHRLPWLVTAGALLLGWIAGGLAASDAALQRWLSFAHAPEACGAAGAALVWLAGRALRPRH